MLRTSYGQELDLDEFYETNQKDHLRRKRKGQRNYLSSLEVMLSRVVPTDRLGMSDVPLFGGPTSEKPNLDRYDKFPSKKK